MSSDYITSLFIEQMHGGKNGLKHYMKSVIFGFLIKTFLKEQPQYLLM